MRTETRTLVVTGGASGIGRAVAERGIADGWRVAIIDRRERPNDLPDESSELRYTQCDLLESAAAANALESIAEWAQGVDALVISAGDYLTAPFLDRDAAEWSRLFTNNTVTAMETVRRLEPYLLAAAARHGVSDVVIVGAVAHETTFPGGVVYGAAAAAVDAFAGQLRIELRHSNVRVRAVSVGYVSGGMPEPVVPGAHEEYRHAPLTPHDIAAVIHYTLNQPADVNVHNLTMVPTAQGWA